MEIRESMLKIIQTHYDSPSYLKRGPRKIILHNWSHISDRISRIDWVLKELGEKKIAQKSIYAGLEYLITTRLDDDDALNRKFVKVLQDEARNSIFNKAQDGGKGGRLRYFSYPSGYYMNLDKHHIMKKKVRMIAIGLSLVARLEYYPISVYLGDHTKIPLYLRHPEHLPELCQYYKACGDIGFDPEKTRRRLRVIVSNEPMWIRTIHDHNLQHNIQNIPTSIGMKTTSEDNLKFLSQFFELKLKPLNPKPNNILQMTKLRATRKPKLSKPRVKYLGTK
jgi:hypothetical protein